MVAIAFMFGVIAPVLAGENLRQNADGTADWVSRGSGGESVEHPIGAKYLTVLLENVSSATATTAIAVPVTDMRVSYIQTTILGTIATADADLAFHVVNGSSGDVSDEITNGTSRLTITASGSLLGMVDSFTPSKASAANHVGQGDVIRVFSDGASTNDIDVIITISLEPR